MEIQFFQLIHDKIMPLSVCLSVNHFSSERNNFTVKLSERNNLMLNFQKEIT